jgi:hypothetical protein
MLQLHDLNRFDSMIAIRDNVEDYKELVDLANEYIKGEKFFNLVLVETNSDLYHGNLLKEFKNDQV